MSVLTRFGFSSGILTRMASTTGSGTTTRALFSGVEGIDLSLSNGVQVMTLNRPEKLNAFTRDMFRAVPEIFEEAAGNEETKVLVIKGQGKFYSSGNDLGNLMITDKEQLHAMAKKGRDELCHFVDAFIDFPKPLLACVNGPSIGIACTTLALCDSVFASDRAWFQTPFTKVAQAPEGCSSYLFPKIMGHSLANEMLLFNKKMTAEEAKKVGFVAEIFPHVALEEEVMAKAFEIAKLPPNSLLGSKKLIRDNERKHLHEVNAKEVDLLETLWPSEECFQAIIDVITKSKK